MNVSQKGDLTILRDLGSSIELIIFAGGREIARVPLTAQATLSLGRDAVEIASRHIFRDRFSPR